MIFIFSQGWGAGYFLPAPDFFFLAAPAPRFFSSGSGSGSGSKEPKTAGSGSGSPALVFLFSGQGVYSPYILSGPTTKKKLFLCVSSLMNIGYESCPASIKTSLLF